MNDIAIRVENLSKAYKLYQKPVDRLKEALHPLKKKYHKDFYALKDLSFEIKKGETVGIVGKNGSGKSTLLKLITGVTTPSGGKITVNGRISAILELGAGFNPQMTGLENIYLNTSINGMSRQETDSKVAEIIAFAELGEFIHQPVKTYSSGMKARLAFAVSISVEPDILIVDEALSVGDAAFQRKCFAKMEDIRAKGATILFVSHSEASVVALCNRAIWISQGEKILDGTPKLVTSLYLKHISGPITKEKIQQEYSKLIDASVDHTHHGNIEQNAKAESKSVKQEASVKKQDNLASFNPSLKPTSTVEYEPKGAQIFDVKVIDLAGKEVNILEHGKSYIYSYCFELFEDSSNIKLGMGFKDLKGNLISGGIYPRDFATVIINKGRNKISWKFKCMLNPGVYVTNCGILNSDKSYFLHRVIDSYLFKVVNWESGYDKAGYVDLNYDIELLKEKVIA